MNRIISSAAQKFLFLSEDIFDQSFFQGKKVERNDLLVRYVKDGIERDKREENE
ncbi:MULTISPECIES: hypothetical protein [Methanobacterium]|jgi:hypothetical protein|uniref:Uncharacterized protein n=1 Tax=Methanobacterium veterum TaxID=408577 RepID=A0A9E5A1T2_9EURY|nr:MULTISPECIES: hypothetical protein [Methanobacterium]MCZ3365209.1 hypothetical protein [Methanobacterium veterum]MCZ3372964.1 hypothetical protein [Methanobacterium veterum]